MITRSLLVLTLFAATATAQDAKYLRLGTWNLEQFGNRKPPRTEESFRKIAAFVRDNHVDVLAVQEINGGVPLQRLCKHLSADWRFVIGTSGVFRGADNRISPGFLWNSKRVTLLEATELDQLPKMAKVKVGSRELETNIFHRSPVSATFRVIGPNGESRLDFRAITVHLKASTRRKPEESDVQFMIRNAKNVAKRKAEVTELRKYIEMLQKTSNEDQDILVLGDFNHTYGTEEHKSFTAGDFVRYPRTPNNPRTIIYFAPPIDHFALTKGLGEELVVRSRAVHAAFAMTGDRDVVEANKQKWKEFYSDHLLVTLDLKADKDRDPKATFTRGKPMVIFSAAKATGPKTGTDEPFQPGAKVHVHLADGGVLRNVVLLRRLGDWVVFKNSVGDRVALPREQVRRVEESR